MKKMRKGFTLVELIIVMAIVAILGTTVGMSLIGSTASAKATAIISNIDTIKGQTRVYYAKYWNNAEKVGGKLGEQEQTVTTTTMLDEAMPNWKKYFEDTDVIKYTPDDTNVTKSTQWAIKVNFANDPESKDIAEVLHQTKLYKDAYDQSGYKGYKITADTSKPGGEFKVFLLTGEVSADKDSN